MDEGNYENTWTHAGALVTGLCDFNWDVVGEGQVTTAILGPKNDSDLSLDSTRPGYLVDGQDLTTHLRIEHHSANTALSLNTYNSAAFSATNPLASVVLPPEPQDHHTEYLSGVKQLPSTQSLARVDRKSKLCIKCWVARKKCEKEPSSVRDSRCLRCIKFDIPAYICTSERVTLHKPFQKWKDETYQILFTTVIQTSLKDQKVAQLQHYVDGPTLKVACCKFTPTQSYQIHALRKNSSGWHWTKTTAYCVANNNIDISLYIRACVSFAMDEVCQSQHPVSFFFQLARYHNEVSIIRDCLEMYTTLRLIRIGWRFSGEETLGMATIKDKQSAWYDTIPVPRMVQNQLGHLFELHIIDLDEKILKALHVILEKRDRRMWVVGTLAVFLLLHVRELDAGRNIYWRRYRDSGGFWIHPSMPTALIDEMVASCNSLLWHYHCSVGQQPLTLNWDSQKSMDLVDNNDTIVISMKALQSYVSKLKQDRLIGRKASDLYEDGNPNSVALTVSSLMFASINDSKVDDFH